MEENIINKIRTKWLCALLLSIALLMLLLLRPDQLWRNGMLYPDDDYSYFAHASSIAFGQFPNYSNEYFTAGTINPTHSIGAGIMAAPFVWAFSILDSLQGSSIINKRDNSNIKSSWSLFGFIFSTHLYFYASCLLLYFLLIRFFPPPCAFWSILLMVLIQGVPLFVFRRPIFSHIDTLFLHILLLFICMRGVILSNTFHMLFNILVIGLLSSLTFLIRYEHFLFAFSYPLIIFIFNTSAPLKRRYLALIASYALAISISLYFINQLEGEKVFTSYQYFLTATKNATNLYFYLNRLGHLLVGIDWGLIFTAPFLLIALASLHKTKPFNAYWLLLLALSFNLFITLKWSSQGGWYGYRYLIFSAIPLLIFPFAHVIDQTLKRKLLFPLLLIGILPFISMLCFEGPINDLKLRLLKSAHDWGNSQYQWVAWQIALNPATLMLVLLRGVPFYFLCLFTALFYPQDPFFASLRDSYFSLNAAFTLKTLILISLPFLLIWLIIKINQHHQRSKCKIPMPTN